MQLLSKRAGSKLPFKEKLRNKIASLLEIQPEQSSISYVDAQYILNNKKIKQSSIHSVLSKLYGERWQLVNREWKQVVGDDKILEDIFVLKRKMIEEQWVYENKSNQRIKQKQMQFQHYLGKIKDKKDMQHRIKVVKDQINVLEVEIDKAKKESEIKILQDKYDELKKEYTFLTNRHRRMKELASDKHTLESQTIESESKIQHLQHLIQEKSKEKERKQYVEALNKNIENCNIVQTKLSGQKRIKALEEIFSRYAGKEPNERMLFGEFVSAKQSLSLQTLLKLLGETQIASLLTNEEKVKIIKQNSRYSRKIDFNNFVQTLKAICEKNSQKLKVNFSPEILEVFLDEFVSKISTNSRLDHYCKSPLERREGKPNDLSKYRYKLQIHSGKFQQNIEQELLARKNSKKNKLASIKQRSVTIDYRTNKPSRLNSRESKNINNDNRYAGFTPQKNLASEPPELLYYDNQSVTSKMSSPLNYAMIFQQRKKSQNNRKRYSTQNSIPFHQREARYPEIITKKTPNQMDFHSKTPSRKVTPESSIHKMEYELENLIDDEDDPFLTSHLQKKSLKIDTDLSPKKVKKIHF